MSKNVELDKEIKEEPLELRDLLEKNLKLTNEIHDIAVYVKKYIFWQKIFGFLKIFIFVIPLVIGIIYLPPLLNQVLDQYKTILEMGSNVNNMPSLDSLSPNFLKYIKK